MIAQYIRIDDDAWDLVVYYDVTKDDFVRIVDSLEEIGCSKNDIEIAIDTLKNKNTGLTYSDTERRISVMCISEATSPDQFISTAIHEADHVQAHICQYYNVELDSERAAYLIGYIVRRMYKILKIYV